jgi:hypothetical protein
MARETEPRQKTEDQRPKTCWKVYMSFLQYNKREVLSQTKSVST